jgi:hypothetical protein
MSSQLVLVAVKSVRSIGSLALVRAHHHCLVRIFAGLLPACRAPRSKAAEAALIEEATSLRPGETQLLLSLLRLLELAADDSGLREKAMNGVAGVLGAALAAHPVAFAAR